MRMSWNSIRPILIWAFAYACAFLVSNTFRVPWIIPLLGTYALVNWLAVRRSQSQREIRGKRVSGAATGVVFAISLLLVFCARKSDLTNKEILYLTVVLVVMATELFVAARGAASKFR